MTEPQLRAAWKREGFRWERLPVSELWDRPAERGKEGCGIKPSESQESSQSKWLPGDNSSYSWQGRRFLFPLYRQENRAQRGTDLPQATQLGRAKVFCAAHAATQLSLPDRSLCASQSPGQPHRSPAKPDNF